MWTWQQKQKKIYPEVHKPQLPVLHLVPCNTVCWRTAKIHLQEESVCKQVISDYHAGKVHLELLQGKRACTLCVFNAQVSRIISTSVLQQHLHPTITWKWLHAVNLGEKNWWLSIPIRFTRRSLRQRGGEAVHYAKKLLVQCWPSQVSKDLWKKYWTKLSSTMAQYVQIALCFQSSPEAMRSQDPPLFPFT
jgi:hypothetical protein